MNRTKYRRKPQTDPVILADPVLIEGVAEGGKGVARVDGKALFVSGALVGETVLVAITRRHARYDEAQIVEMIHPSPLRQEPPCSFYESCGGCSLQHQLPAAQIDDKQNILVDQLSRIGKIAAAELAAPIVGSAWGYRGKARLAVRYLESKQRVLVGFKGRGHHGVVGIDECPVLDTRVSALLKPLAAMIETLTVCRRIPQIEVATDAQTLVLVFRHLDPLPEGDRLRLREFQKLHRLRVMLQPAAGESIYPLAPGDNEPLSYRLGDEQLDIQHLPEHFVQVNSGINPKMVSQAMQWLDIDPGERLLDLFCGVGNFTLPMARRAAQVLGVEGDGGLVKQAGANARLNGLTNVEFRHGDLFAEFNNDERRFDKILLDPPRVGAQWVCENIEMFDARRIVYVSCNPATLARDGGILVQQKGFRLQKVGVIDMFPNTSHVESMALFERDA